MKLTQLQNKLKLAKSKNKKEMEDLHSEINKYREIQRKTSDQQNSIERIEKTIEKLKSNMKSKIENIESLKETKKKD